MASGLVLILLTRKAEPSAVSTSKSEIPLLAFVMDGVFVLLQTDGTDQPPVIQRNRAGVKNIMER